jgi:hypothetical protein
MVHGGSLTLRNGTLAVTLRCVLPLPELTDTSLQNGGGSARVAVNLLLVGDGSEGMEEEEEEEEEGGGEGAVLVVVAVVVVVAVEEEEAAVAQA